MSPAKDRSRRLRHAMKTAMPVALDCMGTILLSGSAMLFTWAAAGILYGSASAALVLGFGCLSLNRNYNGQGSRRRR